jgi:hypothetical protein
MSDITDFLAAIVTQRAKLSDRMSFINGLIMSPQWAGLPAHHKSIYMLELNDIPVRDTLLDNRRVEIEGANLSQLGNLGLPSPWPF